MSHFVIPDQFPSVAALSVGLEHTGNIMGQPKTLLRHEDYETCEAPPTAAVCSPTSVLCPLPRELVISLHIPRARQADLGQVALADLLPTSQSQACAMKASWCNEKKLS